MTEQEWEDKLDEVQRHSENWYNKYKQAEEKIAELEQQIEKMKCCENCKFRECNKSSQYQTCWYCKNKDKWQLGR